jgi:hypothetical protein
MQLEFDIRKAIAATAFLVEHQGGNLDMFLSLKMLYIADRNSLIKWGKTITGDKFISMHNGPMLSRIYDLFKGIGAKKNQQQWNEHFSELVNHSIRLLKDADIGVLSKREMETLEDARNYINSCAPRDVADWLHKECPEWKDPGASSVPINIRVILQNYGRTADEIETMEESNRAFISAKELLGIS